MPLMLERHAGVDGFERRAAGLLTRREAENNLILGLCASLRDTPSQFPEPAYLATVADDAGEVVAAALRTPPYQLTLSAAPAAALELIARDALAAYGALPGAAGPAATSRAFADLWIEL